MYASDLKHTLPSLEEKLHQLYTLNREKKIDLSFRPPYLDLLKNFENPHLNLPPTIHVAGTNGKGSTIAVMRSILEEAGYKVHAYTSPHLCNFNERIYLAGDYIHDKALETLIDKALSLNNNDDVTFFEITTAIAFAAFAQTPADILLLEVGMGGRLDCTNVIQNPLVTLITPIAYDHTEHLGNTLSDIAREKAGIIKKNAPCIIGAQNKHAIDDGIINVFESLAKEHNAPLFCYDADWFIEKEESQIRFSFKGQEHKLPCPNLVGPHQIQNTGLALAALKSIKSQFSIPETAYKTGIQKTSWAARLQKIEDSALTSERPTNWELWLDGGHNESASEALAAQAKEWNKTSPKPIHLLIGMMEHKDPVRFLAPLLPFIKSITTIDISDEPAALSAENLKTILNTANPALKITQGASAKRAIKNIYDTNESPGRILIAGSLYLAGHILKDLQIKP